ncbi:unnamed protein product [Prorocentrum cordatum]|uniref:Peptidylprolyl isomerase n=1 Tax=Prorocentrum cordatum TaxID=2364126 RepID=A0ABN9PWM1_9DINO|nr:unnamed protein product [Polarella glacialis]
MAMAPRAAALAVALVAAAACGGAFVQPGRVRAGPAHGALRAQLQQQEPAPETGAGGEGAAPVLAGFALGLVAALAGAQVAWAGAGASSPNYLEEQGMNAPLKVDFVQRDRLRPGKVGQISFVARSRMEHQEREQARRTLASFDAKIKAAPDRAQRVDRTMEGLKRLAQAGSFSK